ncbi:nudC domain-containing protein 2-like isoform X1 [Mytilus edulis]|uniref:nudC domain-containing protein 2-like isoform X1 n=1 Tax=Mytilus edulis TaxID=6550 RepID=UPI0039F047F1
MANFDEKSGIIPCNTPWGKWLQTVEDVFVEVLVPEGTKCKEISINIQTKTIKVVVSGKEVFSGDLHKAVHADEAVWTLEDKKLIRICLPKVHSTAGNCWKSLLKSQYEADPSTFDQMEQKLTLEKFQNENPGFDFSGASITGNYHDGGPKLG